MNPMEPSNHINCKLNSSSFVDDGLLCIFTTLRWLFSNRRGESVVCVSFPFKLLCVWEHQHGWMCLRQFTLRFTRNWRLIFMLALIPIHHVGFWCFLYSRSFSHHFSCLLFYVLLSWKFILSFLFIHFDIVYKQFSLNCSFSLWTAPLTVFHLRFVFFSKRIGLLNKKMFWYIHMFTFGMFSIFFQVFLFFCIILCKCACKCFKWMVKTVNVCFSNFAQRKSVFFFFNSTELI